MLKFRSQLSTFIVQHQRWLQAAVIVFAGGFVYSPALHGGWLWDDDGEVRSNPDLRTAAGLGRIWLRPDTPDYLPVKTTVQWVQWHLWGDNVIGYHVTNLALHLLSACLLWHLLRKLGVRLAWLGGLIFAIHPLAVESVAWISELKNTLSLPFMLLAMIAWTNYDEFLAAKRRKIDSKVSAPNLPRAYKRNGEPAVAPGSFLRRFAANWIGSYFLSLTLFILAMLSKGSVVMFPLILLLYAWWKRGRVGRRDLLASAPFFAVSLVLGLVAVAFQFHRAFGGEALPVVGFLSRLAVAGLAVAFYFLKCVLPVDLMPNYPRWAAEPPSLLQFLPWVIIGLVIVGLSRIRSRKKKSVVFGLGWFGLFLLPVIGFVPMAYHRISWVSDHLAYVPLVGVIALAAAAISKFNFRNSKFASVIVVALVAALAASARQYAAVFQSESTLWTYAVRHNPQSWLGYNNLGIEVRAEGRPEEAITLYERALAIHPDDPGTHNNLGIALADEGRVQEAMAQYGQALVLSPEFAAVYGNEGNLLLKSGRAGEAIACFEEALRINPGLAAVRNEMGNALAGSGRLDEAAAQYREALRIDPDFAKPEGNLANALSQQGRYAEAIPHFERMLQLDPTSAMAHYNFGLTLRALGRIDEARAQWRLAAQLNHR